METEEVGEVGGNGKVGRKGRGNCRQDVIYEKIKRKEMNFLRNETQTLVYSSCNW